MKTVEVIGKTVEEAVQNGLSQLDLTIDEAHIDILDGGGKGVLGLLGVKMARVRVSEKQNTSNRAVSFLSHVAGLMGSPDPGIAVAEDTENLKIKMEGENLGNMIGHRGETLEALQLLTGLIVNHHNGETEDDYIRIKLDIGGYRKKRKETLTRLAHKLAHKASTNKAGSFFTARPASLIDTTRSTPLTPSALIHRITASAFSKVKRVSAT